MDLAKLCITCSKMVYYEASCGPRPNPNVQTTFVMSPVAGLVWTQTSRPHLLWAQLRASSEPKRPDYICYEPSCGPRLDPNVQTTFVMCQVAGLVWTQTSRPHLLWAQLRASSEPKRPDHICYEPSCEPRLDPNVQTTFVMSPVAGLVWTQTSRPHLLWAQLRASSGPKRPDHICYEPSCGPRLDPNVQTTFVMSPVAGLVWTQTSRPHLLWAQLRASSGPKRPDHICYEPSCGPRLDPNVQTTFVMSPVAGLVWTQTSRPHLLWAHLLWAQLRASSEPKRPDHICYVAQWP